MSSQEKTNTALSNCSASAIKKKTPDQNLESTKKRNKDLERERENALPLLKLPLPSLEATCSRYLKAIQPIVEEESFEKTKQIVNDFKRNEGALLHSEIEKLDQDPQQGSWLKGFWDRMYLTDREPLVVNVNPFFMLNDHPMYTKAFSQVDRATSLIYSFLQFYRKIKRGQLSRDFERNYDKKLLPLCMSQYSNLFAANRIPQLECDIHAKYSKSTHIVVLVAGQFYWFDVFDREQVEKGDWKDVSILSEYDIEVNLRFILNHFKTSPFAERLPPIGALTTLNRDKWAVLREKLMSDNSLNKKSLEKVESALFAVCLDDVAPSSQNDVSKVLLHGDGRNRWFDKSLQLIIASNGKSGINMEHCGLDGHTVLRFATDVYLDSIKHYSPRSRSLRLGRLEPRLLHWKLSPTVVEGISQAGSMVDKIIEQVETQVLEFTDYGKDLIISHKLSPDGYVQMGFQLAYYRVFGQICNVYESCSTKRYAFGRTETLRGITKECLAFLHAFTLASLSRVEKLKKLRAAVDSHTNLMKDCKDGKGVDRHLFAMKNVAIQKVKEGTLNKIPEIFEDPSYKIFSESVLSTSNCGGKALILFGFGPVVERGFGIGYLINSESIIVNLTSRHRRTNFFMKALEWSFLYMRAVLEDDVNSFTQISRM